MSTRAVGGESMRWFTARAASVVALCAVLLATGWAISAGHSKPVLVLLGAAVVLAVALTQRGVFIGLFVLAAMNGLPFVNTSPVLVSKFTIEDAAVFVLLITAAGWIIVDGGRYRPSRAGRLISRAGALLLVWWLITLLRLYQEVPFLRGASFGRDFAFFAVTLILLPRVRLVQRDIALLLGVLAAGVCIFAVGQIMIGTGAGNPGSLIHFGYAKVESGVTRIYSSMTDLVTAGLAVSVAICLLARAPRLRVMALGIAALLTTSTIVQLTRARWIGLAIGIVIVITWLMFNGDARVSPAVRRRIGLGLAGILFVGMIATLAIPGIASSGTIVHRVLSVFSDLQKGGGTVAIRERASATLTKLLGQEWPAGLGFIPPSAHYYQGLPHGSIRDSDLGVLNAVATMGIVGAALVYFPVLSMLPYSLRRTSAKPTAPFVWLRYGGAIWIISTLVSSATLVTLFSASGLMMSGLFLTLLVHPVVVEETSEVSVAEGSLPPDRGRSQVGYLPVAT